MKMQTTAGYATAGILSWISISLFLCPAGARQREVERAFGEATRSGLGQGRSYYQSFNSHPHLDSSAADDLRLPDFGETIKRRFGKAENRRARDHERANLWRQGIYSRYNKHEETDDDDQDLSVACKFSKNAREYRTIDGTFNNPKDPNQGASETPFVQTFPPVYDDGTNLLRGTDPDRLYNGFPLPSPRDVSVAFSSETFEDDPNFTDAHIHFSQFIFSDMVSSNFITCPKFRADCPGRCEYVEPCLAGSLPDDDPYLDNSMGCTLFEHTSVRDHPVCGTGQTKKRPKRSRNLATSYLDGSGVYGGNTDTAFRLRDADNIALLKTGTTEYVTSVGKPLLPFQTDATRNLNPCFQIQSEPQRCFIGGIAFFNGNLQLVPYITLFVREHNRVATRLGELNPFWKAEKVYQEARKIVGATIQHITFSGYLATLFPGADATLGKYRGYDPKVDASVFDGFSIVSRLHHMLRPMVERLGPGYQPIEGLKPLTLRQSIFASESIVDDGLDAFIRGDVATPARKPSPRSLLLVDFLRTFFTDLPALDDQRGRDRGVEGYNAWRDFCGLLSCDGQGFDCYRNEIKEESARHKLEKLYGTTKNVELWIGGAAEEPIDGGIIGPTFRCIFLEQFRRIRDGDSFWYEREGVFPPEQLAEIKKTSLARIICDNSDAIDRVPENVFRLSDPDTYVSCDSIKEIDLDKFKATDTCDLEV